MEEYTLKSYEQGFEEEQAIIGTDVAMSWKFAHQTSAARLKEVYSLHEFEPETRHYCFKKDKMVGFLTSKVIEPKEDGKRRASLVFPSVLSGNEEAVDLLIDRALATLKTKDVEVVETYVSAISGNNYDLAKKWGYKHIKDVDNIVFILNGWEIKADQDTSKIREFDQEKDLDRWLSLVKKYDGLTEEQQKQIIEELKDEQDNVVAHLVIEEDGEIVGTTLIYRNEIRTNTANLAFTYVTNSDYLKMLATKVKKIGNKKGIDMFFIWLYRGRLELRKYFEELNFKYGQPSASLFEKELT